MTRTLPQKHTFSLGDEDVVSVDLSIRLNDGEVLTEPTATPVDDNGELTIGSVQVSSSTYKDIEQPEANGDAKVVAIGKAVQFLVRTSADEPTEYTIKVGAKTDGTPARTLEREIELIFE